MNSNMYMMGSIFANHPEILMQSLSSMNDRYADVSSRKDGLLRRLQSMYIRIFGIPEIGFQVRGMYFRDALRNITQRKQLSNVLDIGSGIGNYVFELSRQFPDAQVDGWEIDRDKLSFSKKFAKELGKKNVSFSYGDITKKPSATNTYDLIINIDVLEHIKDYKKALRHMYALLRPGGHIYIHTPQMNQQRFFKRFESWEHEDHVREGFNSKKLKSDLTRLGFEVVSLRHTFGFFGSLAWELNHLLLKNSFVLAGIFYPLLPILARLDTCVRNKKGLGFMIIAEKYY